MITVVLLGSLEDNSMGDFIYKNLSEKFCVTYLSNGNLMRAGLGTDLLLIDTDDVLKCNFTNCIILIKKYSLVDICSDFADNAIAIVSSDQQNHLEALSKLNIQTITCGAYSKDTVTFSSKNEDELVISLQRSISNINNEIIEPFEIPIKKSPNDDDFTILAYAALCAEIGIIDKNWH